MTATLVRKLLLLCVALVLAIVTLAAVSDWRWSPPDARPIDGAMLKPPGLDHGGLDLALLGETLQRPLFMATRRPPPEIVPEVAQDEPDRLADVQVLGLFGSGAAGGAILLIDGVVQRVLYGQNAGQWVLEGVRGNKAEFRRGDGSLTVLELVHLRQPDAPPPLPVAQHASPADERNVAADGAESEEPVAAPPPRATTSAARAQARAARQQRSQLPMPPTQ